MIDTVKERIRNIPDFPKPGIIFRDITTAVRDAEALHLSVDYLANRIRDTHSEKIDYVVGIESRGFIFGSALAYVLDAGFVLIRKPGKLPCETICEQYDLEYGTDEVHMHIDAIEEGKNVVVVDDLLATGGTVSATCRLLKKAKANILATCFIIELTDLNGRDKIPSEIEVISMVEY